MNINLQQCGINLSKYSDYQNPNGPVPVQGRGVAHNYGATLPNPMASARAETCQQGGGFSQSYLMMKQAQEKQTLLERSDANPALMERLKVAHALQLQKKLQITSGPKGLQSNLFGSQYAEFNTKPIVTKIHSNTPQEVIKARGQKYNMLKQMSPELLNRLQGRQSDQSVLPPTTNQSGGNQFLGEGDAYQQSMYRYNIKAPQTRAQLRNQISQRQSQILGQKSEKGIQSFYGPEWGTKLQDAYPF